MNNFIKDENFINIQGWMVTKLKLKGNELLIYAIIYGFSQDGNNKFTGSASYLAEFTNTSKNNVFRVLKSLTDKGYIERFEKNINGVSLVDYQVKNVTGVVTKCVRGSNKMCSGGSNKMLPHNIELDNKEENKKDNIDCKSFKQFSFEEFESEVKQIASDNKIHPDHVSDFLDYWTEKDVTGKMNFQNQKTWETSKRLKRWVRSSKKQLPEYVWPGKSWDEMTFEERDKNKHIATPEQLKAHNSDNRNWF